MIHGGIRDASAYYCAMRQAVLAAGQQHTAVVAPRFLYQCAPRPTAACCSEVAWS